MKGIMTDTAATMTAPATMIIVADARVGETSAFPTMDEFRAAMVACGWTSEDFDLFITDESDPAEVFEADFVRILDDGSWLYRYEKWCSRYEMHTVDYAVYDGGGYVKHLGWDRCVEEDED